MNKKDLVSIIVPFYNAGKFISETLRSVYSQTYQPIEVIIINDGSTDNSDKIVKKLIKETDKYIVKENTGISSSRNLGISLARGEFIQFLDSDDILSSDFIEKRVAFLKMNKNFGYCCSSVIKINGQGKIMDGKYRGIYQNVNEEILLYDQEVISCPSNYLIKRSILTDNKIYFNTNLSSSADRFFLIELSKATKGGIVEGGELYYRVHSDSMSNKLTHVLVKDNLTYLRELEEKIYIPKHLSKDFYFNINYILAGSNYRLSKIKESIKHAIIAFYFKPKSFIKRILKIK